ncbi:ABC transporter permease [Paenibacillus sp. ALE2]
MLALFKAECLKLKGTKILFLSVFILIVTVFLTFSTFAVSPKFSLERNGWNDYFMDLVFSINFITGYMSYYILTCYIYAREYQEKTHIALFSNPVRRSRLYFSKLLVIYMYIAVSLLLTFALSAILGMFITTRPLTFGIVMCQLGIFIKMVLMHAMLIPMITFFAVHWKKFVPAIMGMCTVMCLNFVLVNAPGNTFYPWAVPFLFSPHGTFGRTFTYVPGGIISICFIFVLGLFLALRSYVRIEK